MTWDTPLGDRIVTGVEKRLLELAISEMATEILAGPDDSIRIGVDVFDAMTGCLQLVMLDCVKTHLFNRTSEPAPSTAVIEGTAGAVLWYIESRVEGERAAEKDGQRDPTRPPHDNRWTELMMEAIKEYGWDVDVSLGDVEWSIAYESLYNRILHDDDYNIDGMDRDPAISKIVKKDMGIPAGYYSTPPLPEPDGPAMVDIIRRIVLWY